jgi:hypothetical protein
MRPASWSLSLIPVPGVVSKACLFPDSRIRRALALLDLDETRSLVTRNFKYKITGMTFKSGNDDGKGRPSGARNRGSYELRERLKSRPSFVDPAEYLCDIVSNPNASTECKIAASGNLMPYLYSKLGAITPPRFIETKIAVPEIQNIDDLAQFIIHVLRHVARGSLSFEHGKELVDLARASVHTKYADDELKLKIAAADNPLQPQRIIIEGGLPSLPGTNITMPQLNGHDLELTASPGPATNDPHSHPAEPDKP